MKRPIISCIIILFFLSIASTMDAQINTTSEFILSGIVTDEEQLPITGAVITLKKEGKIAGGTTTNLDGRYSIRVHRADSLLFSFIGYTTQAYRVGDKEKRDVRLSFSVTNLNEIVVTGYQTISKERATGSFAKVSSTTLDKQRLSNLSTLLEGQVAGFTGGTLRGTTSMYGSTSPLYVVDGFPIENVRYDAYLGKATEDFPELNMEDIESITVLKDAAATSIYGARAANGVVVIVTKSATQEKVQVSFASTFTFSPYTYYKDGFTNSSDIIGIEKEWAANNKSLHTADNSIYVQNMLDNNIYPTQGITSILNYHAGKMSGAELEQKLNSLATQNYSYYNDVEKYAKRDPFYQQYNLSIGKTSGNNMFKASITYRDNKNEDRYSQDQSVGINITNSLAITTWLKLDLSTYNHYQNEKKQSASALSPGYKYMPYDVLKNSDGSNYTSLAASRLTKSNYALIDSYGLYNMDVTALDELSRNVAETKSFQNRTSGRLHLKFTQWLSFSTLFQYEYGSERYSKLSDKSSYEVRSRVNNMASRVNNATVFNLPYGNIYNTVDFYSKAYTFRQQLNFDRTFGGKHQVTALIGNEVRENKNEFANNTLFNYDPNLLSYTLIDAATLAKGVSPFWGGYFSSSDIASKKEVTNRFISYYGNAAYSYEQKYLFTGSLRWDRSNLWGTASKYQNKPIWSTGIGWNIDKESFLTVPWIDRLKLRTSYGIGGNIAKDKAPYMVAYYSTNANVGGLQGSISSRPNPALTWEKTTTTNVGVDFALFKNRINGTIEYYNKYGKDLLASTMGIPTEGFGYSTYQINNGEMRNRGVELTLSGSAIRSKNFEWSPTLVYGYNKNKVTYVNVKAPVYYLQMDYPLSYPRIGNAYQAIYAYKWAGLSKEGLPQVYNEKNEVVSTTPTSLDAIVYAGTTVPIHSGSFSNNFRYKNFDLSFMLIFEAGHKMRNTFLPALNSAWSSAAGSYITNISSTNKDIVNRWQTPGDEAHTNIPRIIFAESPYYSSNLYSIYANADINVIDASNLRLSNISLSYRVPTGICQKVFLSNARLQFNVENLMTLAKSTEAKYLLGGYNSPNFVWGLYLNF